MGWAISGGGLTCRCMLELGREGRRRACSGRHNGTGFWFSARWVGTVVRYAHDQEIGGGERGQHAGQSVTFSHSATARTPCKTALYCVYGMYSFESELRHAHDEEIIGVGLDDAQAAGWIQVRQVCCYRPCVCCCCCC
jgi:hypothetical protein